MPEDATVHAASLAVPATAPCDEIPDWSPTRPSLDPPELKDSPGSSLTRAVDEEPRLEASGVGSLFELDVPVAGLRAPSGAKGDSSISASFEDRARPAIPEGKRSTMEFLYELDAPARITSREIDLEADPELAAALATIGARPLSSEVGTTSSVAESEPREPILPMELGVLLPAPDRPATAEEQHEQRRKRAITRIQTCRDSFRLLGFAGLPDADRKTAARLFMELDQAIGRQEGEPSAIKDPDTALADASRELLDTVDRLLGPIEDRLLALDQMVTRDAFQECIASRKLTKKIIVRYGRLLASRRFQADERRNRFEWIATLLLTATDPGGLQHPLPPESARLVLQRLIGGLPYKSNEQELLEALEYLRESIARMRQFVSAEEFLESGFYVDAHGYRVTMRDQLLVPEFLYFSVVLNATIHNRVESWISDLERLHSSNQLRQEGSPREQIVRGLRAQEEAVENALGVKRRAPVPAPGPEPARAELDESAPAKPKPKPKKREKKARGEARFEIIWDRNMITAVVSLVVILGVTGYLLTHTGAIGKPTVHAMTGGELSAVSTILARGWIMGSGEDRRLNGSIFANRWEPLDGRRRREEAERIAGVLAVQGIKTAEIKQGSTVVIRITDGYAAEVLGGKL